MKLLSTLVPVLLTAWMFHAGCATSDDAQPSTDETTDEVVATPCANAANGLFCGGSRQLGFGNPIPGDPSDLYTCRARMLVGEVHCVNGCVIEQTNTADHCR